LWYWYEPAGTTTWHEQEVAAGGGADYDDPAIAWTGSSVVIAAVNAQGNLEYWWQAVGTRPWNQQQVAPLGLVALGAGQMDFPSIATAGDSVLITAIDSNGNLNYYWQQYGTTPWNEQQVAAG
jgi:hypothetical protein